MLQIRKGIAEGLNLQLQATGTGTTIQVDELKLKVESMVINAAECTWGVNKKMGPKQKHV